MISLVMTTYNGLKYISEQLESIKNQTVLPDEVLIYDDRSTDGTYEYVQEYIQTNKLDKWNVVRNKENKGYSLNFSDAMKESHGDIVFLCDQDDIWHLDKIKVMSEIMNSHPEIELLASNVHPFYMGEHPQRVHYQKYKGDLIKIRRLGEWIKPARPGCTMCFRRTLMKNYQSLWFRESMNMWGLTPDFLDVLEEGFKEFFEKGVPGNPQKAEYLIPIFIGELLEQGKMSVKVLKTNDTWYGMTYHEDVAAVKDSFKKMLEKGVYKADLFVDL